MKERPILFSGEMVQAILSGTKTQTRWVVKPQGGICFSVEHVEGSTWATYDNQGDGIGLESFVTCPYGVPGDRLWVRETWRTEELESGLDGVRFRADNAFREIENTQAAADAWMDANKTKQWRPSIFMPRWASRLTLEIADVRVERVQNISEADAWAEGAHYIAKSLPYSGDDLGRVAFSGLWESINAERGYGWSANPWVWVVGFKVVQR